MLIEQTIIIIRLKQLYNVEEQRRWNIKYCYKSITGKLIKQKPQLLLRKSRSYLDYLFAVSNGSLLLMQ